MTYIICSLIRILNYCVMGNFWLQFRPVVPTQQGQPFISSASQQFRPVGQGYPSNVAMPAGPGQPLQFSQPIQQLPSRPTLPGHAMPSSQAMQLPYGQTNRPLASVPLQSQHSAPLTNHMPGSAGPGVPISSSYTVRFHYGFPPICVLLDFVA